MSNVLAAEAELETKKEYIKKGEYLEALYKNKYFKYLIRDNYLKTRAINCVKKHGMNGLTEDSRNENLAEINGISQFNKFLDEIKYYALNAKSTINETRDALDSALEEEL